MCQIFNLFATEKVLNNLTYVIIRINFGRMLSTFLFALLLGKGKTFNYKYQDFHINQINFFFKCQGIAGGAGGQNFYFLYNSTFKHKYQYLRIIQRNSITNAMGVAEYQRYFSINPYISENIPRDKQLFKLVKVHYLYNRARLIRIKLTRVER